MLPQPVLGSPIPVWESTTRTTPTPGRVRLAGRAGAGLRVRPTDLHRPHIRRADQAQSGRPDGALHHARVPEVLDCWFESGSMPFAQVQLPVREPRVFEYHYPGDFIVEYNGQTRGWFYTLHVLATRTP